jgi:hypothetical protein
VLRDDKLYISTFREEDGFVNWKDLRSGGSFFEETLVEGMEEN